jgi:predicted membrane-bound spermidine synthase
MIFLIVFITGFIAIGYEIVWFRIISTIVKASPYAFSSILFVYLFGLALGSFFMKKHLLQKPGINRRNLFFQLQFLIGLFVLLSILVYYYLVKHVPLFASVNRISFTTMEHPHPYLPSTQSFKQFLKDIFNILDVFLWPSVFIFIPTIFMGASFPLITSLAFKGHNAGNVVGKIYFFNVLGNVAGGLITGLFLLKAIGSELSILTMSVMGLLFAIFLNGKREIFKGKYKLAMVVLLILIAFAFFPKRGQLYNVIHPITQYHSAEMKVINEGVDAVIVTYGYKDSLSTYLNGMSHGGRPYMDFFYEAIETLSFHPQPQSVLVIGFGTGSTVEMVQKAAPSSKIKLVELSTTLLQNLKNVSYLKNYLEHPNLDIYFADGRKYLYNSSEKFDAIFIDPLRTTTAFSNNLYSAEFFQLIRDHLKEKGVFMVWTDEYNIVPKTLAKVFPNVRQYSYFCIASHRDLVQDSTFKTKMFMKFSQPHLARLLLFDSTERRPMHREQILARTVQFPINKDYKPHCEFYLGKTF